VCVCACVSEVRSTIAESTRLYLFKYLHSCRRGHKDLVYNFYDRCLVFQGGILFLIVTWFGCLIVGLAVGILISSRIGSYYWLVYSLSLVTVWHVCVVHCLPPLLTRLLKPPLFKPLFKPPFRVALLLLFKPAFLDIRR
jgi:hypothetical protein